MDGLMREFSGRHIVVTGGTGALGTSILGMLLGAGAVCHVPAVSAADADRSPHKGHDRVHIAPDVDLRDDSAVRGFYEGVSRAAGQGGGLWASLHTAGGFDMGPVESVSGEAWRKTMDLNALSCFLCCREAVRAIRAAGGGGRIVNVAARPALRPEQGARMVAYTASKAAVAALTGALAAEVVAEGILVNAVAPSIMDTPANRAAMPDAEHARWPGVGEVAAAILWLASPGNALTSGTVVPVYGRS
jgi:NAD(P)-dependent dehydrogenase (short-subunit alcohol dehydrogenase family)